MIYMKLTKLPLNNFGRLSLFLRKINVKILGSKLISMRVPVWSNYRFESDFLTIYLYYCIILTYSLYTT